MNESNEQKPGAPEPPDWQEIVRQDVDALNPDAPDPDDEPIDLDYSYVTRKFDIDLGIPREDVAEHPEPTPDDEHKPAGPEAR